MDKNSSSIARSYFSLRNENNILKVVIFGFIGGFLFLSLAALLIYSCKHCAQCDKLSKRIFSNYRTLESCSTTSSSPTASNPSNNSPLAHPTVQPGPELLNQHNRHLLGPDEITVENSEEIQLADTTTTTTTMSTTGTTSLTTATTTTTTTAAAATSPSSDPMPQPPSTQSATDPLSAAADGNN